ncbi:MAG: hypothetical protein RIS79_1272 [Verrucomicrobiota bacterium]|jgi:hypothetical protein
MLELAVLYIIRLHTLGLERLCGQGAFRKPRVPLTDPPTVVSIDASWDRVIYEEPYDATITPSCFGRVQVTLP